MSILSKTIALTVCKCSGLATVEGLKKFAFQSIDEQKTETLSFGWVNFDDQADSRWQVSPPEKGQYMVFALRVDTRKIKPAILKKHIAEAYKKELASGEKERISRARKKELKEQITLKLLSSTEPSPITIDVVQDLRSGLVYIASRSDSVLNQVKEHWTLSFGSELEELCLAGLEAKEETLKDSLAMENFLSEIYSSSISINKDDHEFTVSENGSLELLKADGRSVKVKNEPDASAAGLNAGLYINSLALVMMRDNLDEWKFTLGANFRFSGLTCPPVVRPADSNSDDSDAVFLEKIYLMEQAVEVMHGLFNKRWG